VVQFEGVVSKGQDGFVPSILSGAESVVHGVVAAVLPAPGRPPLQGRRQPRPGDQRAHHEVVVEDHGVLHQLGGHQVLATWGEVPFYVMVLYSLLASKIPSHPNIIYPKVGSHGGLIYKPFGCCWIENVKPSYIEKYF